MGNKQTSSSPRKQLNKQKTTSHLNVDGSWNPIPDQYHSLEEVQQGLRRAGLESCNLIFGIDLTSSNTSQGKRTYQGKSLHSLSFSSENPYEKCLDIKCVPRIQSIQEQNFDKPIIGTKNFNIKSEYQLLGLTQICGMTKKVAQMHY